MNKTLKCIDSFFATIALILYLVVSSNITRERICKVLTGTKWAQSANFSVLTLDPPENLSTANH
jgi:hypothetical protein